MIETCKFGISVIGIWSLFGIWCLVLGIYASALPLFMLRIRTDDAHDPFSLDDLAPITNLFYGCLDFHLTLKVILPRLRS